MKHLIVSLSLLATLTLTASGAFSNESIKNEIFDLKKTYQNSSFYKKNLYYMSVKMGEFLMISNDTTLTSNAKKIALQKFLVKSNDSLTKQCESFSCDFLEIPTSLFLHRLSGLVEAGKIAEASSLVNLSLKTLN